MRRIRKFLQLSRSDQLLLIQTILVLALVTLGLRIFPWQTLQRLLLKLSNWHPRFVTKQVVSAKHITWAIRVASWYIPKATCLPQALAAQHLLIQRTHPADLQIGVARNKAGKLEAHAWVTSNNSIIIGGVHASDRFVLLSPMDRRGIGDYDRAL
jgi:hypothetical protein